jgi:hypothetical protein
MSKPLQEKIDQLYEQAKDLDSIEELKPLCDEFLNWVKEQNLSNESLGSKFSSYKLYSRFKALDLHQDKNAVLVAKHDENGNIKGHVLKHYIHHRCSEFINWNQRNQSSRAIDRIENSTELDPLRYLETTTKLLTSNDPHELAVGLIAATGRRPHEILARAKFTAVKDKLYHVNFEGQGKKRGETPVIEIATLFPAKAIIKALARLRNEPSTKQLLSEIEADFPNSVTRQNVEIDKRRNQSLNRVVRAYFGDTGNPNPVLAFRHNEKQDNNKALRAAYAVLATERDCKGGYGAKILHASKLLGHFSKETRDDRNLGSIATSIGYSDYYVTKPVPFGELPEEKVVNVRAYQSDLEAIKKLQALWDCENQQEVTQRLVKSGEHVKSLENQLFEAQKRIRELEKQLNERPSVDQDLTDKVKMLIEENTRLRNQLNNVVTMNEHIDELETPTTATTATRSSSDERIDKLEAIVMQLVEKLNQPQPQTIVAPVSTPTASPVPTPVQPVPTPTPISEPSPKRVLTTAIRDIDWESISNQELKGMKHHGAVEEKIKRAYQAITAHNDNAPSNDERYFIGNVSLREVSRCNGLAVGAWLEQYQTMVDDHNHKYGLGKFHNKGKATITETINIWE